MLPSIIRNAEEILSSLDSRIRLESNKPEIEKLAEKYGAHVHQVVRYIETLGSISEAEQFLSSTEDSVFKTIRTNTLKIQRRDLISVLREKGLEVEEYKPTPYGIVVHFTPLPIGALHEYLYGYYIVQGPAPMLPVIELDPRDNEVIADTCAGAGVKTTQVSQHAPRAAILALDINRRKLLALKNHASRLGIANIVSIVFDARRINALGLKFDKILLDAPCSGEGLWPLKKGRWPRSFDDIASRVPLQLELIYASIKALKRGGILVYSTCSISVEENELVISTLLNHLDDVVVEPLSKIETGLPGVREYFGVKLHDSVVYCRRLYPHVHRTEGFTICKLRKKA